MNRTLLRCSIDTPIGPMIALASGDALCALEFDSPQRQAMLKARLVRFYDDPQLIPGDNPILRKTRRWVDSYFAGKIEEIPVPLDARGTLFETRVWQLLRAIPAGTRATYGQLAEKLGLSAGARAVGGGSRRNPISLIVPCHRVVGSSGSLTGYGGGIDNKGWLLGHEARCAPRGQYA